MRSRLLACIVTLATSMVWIGPVGAVECYLDFVNALRQQGYYDSAVEYLDQIASRANTPAEIKQLIPYEKAMTLLANSRSTRSPDRKAEQLDQALVKLEEFLQDNPDHPMAAEANSNLGQIFLDKGRADVLQSKSPLNQGSKSEFQERARELISNARQAFQAAYDQDSAIAKSFPPFIDKAKNPEQSSARAKLETNLISASLNLARCTYEEAQTYDAGSNDFKMLLSRAAEEFEKMYQKYRSQVGGLYARAWQGKCYEKQRDYQKALGLYGELLQTPGDDPALSVLKTQALYFKVTCLNTTDRHDYQVVVDLVDEWLKKHPNETRTNLGLGLQWEQARACESLGGNPDLLKVDQERLLRQARAIAIQIQKVPCEYSDAATAMIWRLADKLVVNLKEKNKAKEANDFAAANRLASSSVKSAQEIKNQIDNSSPLDDGTLKLEYANALNDAIANFELAFSLVRRDDDRKEIANACLFYAYVHFWLRNNYEAAVLADHVVRTSPQEEGILAQDAAYLAMAAYVQAFSDNKSPLHTKGEDMQLIIRACNRIADRWPSSEKADEAYMILGRMYSALKKPLEAAEWFGKVASTNSKFPESQINAGQCCWTAYLNASRLPDGRKPPRDEMDEWLNAAQDHLRRGIDRMSAVLPNDHVTPAELIAAKLSLAQIYSSQERHKEVLKLLLDDPHSVIKAVSVLDEGNRPETGVASRKLAVESYKLLLTGYIGTRDLEAAILTMTMLSKISSADGDQAIESDVIALRVGLLKWLQPVSDLLRAEGDRWADDRDVARSRRLRKLIDEFETSIKSGPNEVQK